MPLPYPILVIAYADESRAALANSLISHAEIPVPCTSFAEAENIALQGLFCGILIDLPASIKAKGDEKTIACSLSNFFPTLRVRTMGSMLVPMAMPGDAKQDSSLKDFIAKSCSGFTPRRLRLHRRKEQYLPAIRQSAETEERCFVVNISWGGAFILDTHPERFSPGDSLLLHFPEFQITTPVAIRWSRPWDSGRRLSGYGVEFTLIDHDLRAMLTAILGEGSEQIRDRLVAR